MVVVREPSELWRNLKAAGCGVWREPHVTWHFGNEVSEPHVLVLGAIISFLLLVNALLLKPD